MAAFPPLPKLMTTDHEDLVLCKAVFLFMISKLPGMRCEGILRSRRQKMIATIWKNESDTILGNLKLTDTELTLEMLSRKRLNRGKKLLRI